MLVLFILFLYTTIGIFCFGIFEKIEKDRYRFNLDYFIPVVSILASIVWPITLFILMCYFFGKTIYNLSLRTFSLPKKSQNKKEKKILTLLQNSVDELSLQKKLLLENIELEKELFKLKEKNK